MQRPRWIPLAGLAFALCGCGPQAASPNRADVAALGVTLPDIHGEAVSPTAEYPDDVVVLAFWATWCQPCQQELSKMTGVYRAMQDRGLQMYAVSIDGPDTASQVATWVQREGYPFPVLLDRETQVLKRFNPRGEIPYYVVLDARGNVIRDHQGYMSGDVDALSAFLDQVLREQG